MLKPLEKPKRLEYDTATLTPYYGKFTAEPFERGFGTTMANALRRILLASIPGAAITAVKIEGVYHEFSTIPGVVEDTTDILLNLKEIRFKMYVDHPKTAYIRVDNRSGEVKAGEIITDADVEVINPELVIATLDNGASLQMELTVEKGRGYLPAELNKKEDAPIGVIFMDANFSPVNRVVFHVEDMFLGATKTFDRLIIEVWTDSSISPEEAIIASARTLRENCSIFINFEEQPEEEQPKVDERVLWLQENLERKVDELELSVRAANCLKNANIRTMRELVIKTEPDMLKTKNFGRKSLNEIKELLVKMGLSLGLDPDELPSSKLVSGGK